MPGLATSHMHSEGKPMMRKPSRAIQVCIVEGKIDHYQLTENEEVVIGELGNLREGVGEGRGGKGRAGQGKECIEAKKEH